jgi:hypothetical protein
VESVRAKAAREGAREELKKARRDAVERVGGDGTE